MPPAEKQTEVFEILDRHFPPEARFRSLLNDTPDWRALADSILTRQACGEPMDLPAELFRAGVDWTRSVKVIRTILNKDIREAQAILLSHPGWLRWCKQRIKTDASCLKQAHYAARNDSLPEWIALRDGKVVFLK